MVDLATRGKPSVITRHGKPEAVVLGFADWERLSRVPSFGRLLMSAPLEPGDMPERSRVPLRDAGLYAISGRYQCRFGDRAHRWRETFRADGVDGFSFTRPFFCRRSALPRSLMASPKQTARAPRGRPPICQPGCKPCCISMAIGCCPSTVPQRKLRVPCRIWRAAAAILQVLPISPSPRRRGGMT